MDIRKNPQKRVFCAYDSEDSLGFSKLSLVRSATSTTGSFGYESYGIPTRDSRATDESRKTPKLGQFQTMATFPMRKPPRTTPHLGRLSPMDPYWTSQPITFTVTSVVFPSYAISCNFGATRCRIARVASDFVSAITSQETGGFLQTKVWDSFERLF